MWHRHPAQAGDDESGDAKPDKHHDVGWRKAEYAGHVAQRDVGIFHCRAPLDDAEEQRGRHKDDHNPDEVEQRHDIILVDHLARHDDGFGLAARNAAQDGQTRLVSATPPQERIADGCHDDRGADHGGKRDHPFVGMVQHRLVEGRADQYAQPQHHGLVKPPCHAEMRLQRPDQRATKPDPEQASHQIGGWNADLHETPANRKRHGEGHGETDQVAHQPCRKEGAGRTHFSHAPLRRSGSEVSAAPSARCPGAVTWPWRRQSRHPTGWRC